MMFMRIDPDRLLTILHGTICASVRSDAPDLSARQMAILLAVSLNAGMHTVRGLAAALNISKPAISRSLDRLCELGLAGREADPRDRRSVLVVPSEAGRAYVADLRRMLAEAARPQPNRRAARRGQPLTTVLHMVAA
jgi:DNA-binding MarR family transcriptional regulator